MPNVPRRIALSERSRALRCTANELNDQLKDAGVKSMLKVSVLHLLDDVDTFFLGDPEKQPSSTVNEEFWLDNTEFVLNMAKNAYEHLVPLIKQYGGPTRLRTIG